MARAKIPDPLARRHLVERDLPPAQAQAIAEAYLADNRRIEAVDFLRKTQDVDRLAELRSQAIEGGDVFLLRAVAAAMKEPPTRDEWGRLGERAQAEGLERYAEQARRQSERSEEGS